MFRPASPPAPRPARGARNWPAVVLPALILLIGLTLLLRPAPKSDPAYAGYTVLSEGPSTVSAAQRTLPANVLPCLPEGTPVCRVTFPRARLLSGKLLLIDEAHAIPEDAAPPNTFSVLQYSHGSLTCRDVSAVLGQETLAALTELFAQARWEHMGNGLLVYRATLTCAQQRLRQTERFTILSSAMSLQEALDQTLREIAEPGHSEHQQGYCVDIRLCDGWDQLPRDEPLTASDEGKWLAENSWRFGFIWRWDDAHPSPDPEEQWHFRFVGKAHAALIHALDATLEEYLSLLHRYGTLTLLDDSGQPRYAALCAETAADLTVALPAKAALEDVSYDSLGWAAASFAWDGSATAAP